MKAILKNYRQAPRKINLIAGLIRGKKVIQAKVILANLIKRGAKPFLKVLESAIANAIHNDKIANVDNYIIECSVNKAKVLKRWMPRAMGRAFPIHKHSSHVQISLKENNNKLK